MAHLDISEAERSRCAAAAALALREPKRVSDWAVGTSVLLGTENERREATLTSCTVPTERTKTPREFPTADATPSATLWDSENDERRCARNEAD
jgi:hypothetical protein